MANAQEPPRPYGVLPSKAQLTWHETEMYCIVHFGVDTYTDKEWGFGDEDPASARYFRYSILHVVAGNGVTMAEVGVRVN